jgi:hypothetical protein
VQSAPRTITTQVEHGNVAGESPSRSSRTRRGESRRYEVSSVAHDTRVRVPGELSFRAFRHGTLAITPRVLPPMNGLSSIVPPPPTPSMVSPDSNSATRIKYGALASGKLGKGGRDSKSETFLWNPAGTNPAWQSRASSQKRVLRGGGATHPAKRRQRGQRSCD